MNGLNKKDLKNMNLFRAKPYIPEDTHQWILEKFESILQTGALIQGKHVNEYNILWYWFRNCIVS